MGLLLLFVPFFV